MTEKKQEVLSSTSHLRQNRNSNFPKSQDEVLEKAKEHLENKYPNHVFDWKYRSGRLWGFCPEHEDRRHPNLNIYIRNGVPYWHCFACGFTGSLLSKEEQEEKAKEKQKKEERQKKAKADLQKAKELLLRYLREKAYTLPIEYLYKRLGKVTEKELQKFDIGLLRVTDKTETESLQKALLAGRNERYKYAIVFGYRNVYGCITGFKVRFLKKDNDRFFRFAKITEEIGFFNVRALLDHPAPFCFVSEGEFDALTPTLNSKFYIPIVALGSSSNFTDKAIQTIARLKRPILAPDQDQAGHDAIKKLLQKKKTNAWIISKLPIPAKDFDELFREVDTEQAKEILAQLEILSLEKYAKQLKEQEKKEKEQELRGQFSSYPKNLQTALIGQETALYLTVQDILNCKNKEVRILGLFPTGAVSIIAGMGKTGKSYVTLKIGIDAVLKENRKVLLWFTEDQAYVVKQRLLSLFDFYGLNEQDKQKIAEKLHIRTGVENTPFFRRENYNYRKIEENYAIYKKLVNEHDLIVLDPLLTFVGVSEKDDYMRDIIQREIGGIVANTDKAIVIIHHVTKISMEKIGEVREKIAKGEELDANNYDALVEAVKGSVDITNVARSVYFLISNQNVANARNLIRIRDNNAPSCVMDYDVKLPFDFNNIAGNENVRKYRNQIPA